MPEEFAFDPLIGHHKDRCGTARSAGRRSSEFFHVAPDRYERLCCNCRMYQTFDLPAIKKTTIYLNQFAISNLSYVRANLEPLSQQRARLARVALLGRS